MARRDRVIIYRSRWLPASETFIISQMRALRRYEPYYAGLTRVPGLSVDDFLGTVISKGARDTFRHWGFKYCGFSPSLLKAAQKSNAVLVHAHFAMDAAECLPIVDKLRMPLIVTLHGWDVCTDDDIFRKSWSGRRFLARRPRLQQKASLFICVSNFIKEQAIKRGFPESKLRVHYIGVDTERLSPAQIVGKRDIVLFVGRLVEQKGLRYLFNAMVIVAATCPTVKLVVIGDGPLRQQHEKEAKELGINCEFIGAQRPDIVHDWMRRSKVFVLPSVREGLGMVLCEAIASGATAIGFASGGIPEVITAGTGLLVTEGDSDALARQIKIALTDDVLREMLTARAREHVLNKFSLALQTEKLEQIYDEVISNASP
jgi:glycosyltransferase involved in cell wall biosynthesis